MSAPRLRNISRALVVLIAFSTYAGAAAETGSASPRPGDGSGFVEVTASLGLDYRLKAAPGHEEPADGNREDGGLTLADIDGDGRLELYVAHGGAETGRLYRWDGRRFERVAGNSGIEPASVDRAGYSVDVDGDGRPDFISVQSTGVQVFRNLAGGRFVDTTSRFDIRLDRPANSMAAADIDSDGDLDLFFAHWGNPWNDVRPLSQYLWRNDGKGRYEDIGHIVPVRPATEPGETIRREFSFTPVFSDIDGDGDPDLLLTGDHGSTQVLRNDAGAAFADVTGPAITDENGMGAAVGDFDGDGDQDWFVASIHDPDGSSGFGPTGNRLYRNAGDGTFADATAAAGVREGGWGWGACAADFDNDGHLDLFQTNGWFGQYVDDANGEEKELATFLRDPSRLFMSNGDGSFSERGAGLGIGHTGQGRGAVCADYDGDGRVDLFIANHGAAPTVYRNVIDNGNRWLAIDLEGRHANPRAVGARVTVRTSSGRQVREARLGGSYLSQGPATLHFGLGREDVVRSVEVRWPGPGNAVSRLADVRTDRRIAIRQPAPEGFLLRVADGRGAGLYEAGARVGIEAGPPRRHYRFSHWTAEGGGVLEDARARRTVFTMPAGPVTLRAHFLPGPAPAAADVPVARRWIELLLQAIRDDTARPTVHARNLFHVSAAMYDAWAAYAGTERPYAFGEDMAPCVRPDGPAGRDLRRARTEAISHAAWRLIRHRFRRSPGATRTGRNTDALMQALGLDAGRTTSAAAALGNCIGEFYIARGLADGSNEANDYASRHYAPVNASLRPDAPGNPHLRDPDRWQPLELDRFVGQSGIASDDVPGFVTPEWGDVAPFALSRSDLTVHERGGGAYRVYHDPGPPPMLRGPRAKEYLWGFALVARWSSQLSPEDGVVLDIAPSGMGNIGALPRSPAEYRAFYEGNPNGPGHDVNPATGRPYEPQVVPRGDYARVLAEFWADGPDSETPPGHWFVILNAVNDHEKLVRRLGGAGPELDPLEWDVKAYFALGSAMHDAAIAAWGIKGRYDYIRPVSALRAMAGRGRSGNPAPPSPSSHAIGPVEGTIGLVEPNDAIAGEDGRHVGKIKLRAWRGPGHVTDPAVDAAGVGWILGENWWPYQRPSFVTPPFAGYVSGHSTFSRAAAEVLTAMTGDPFFPGGMSGFRIEANRFLTFERGPSVGMVLQWATYRDAADQCGLSRIWGGIHPPADDIPGRLIGAKIGKDAFRLAKSYFEGASGSGGFRKKRFQGRSPNGSSIRD